MTGLNAGGFYVSFVIRCDGNVYDSNTAVNVRDPFKVYGCGWYGTYSRNQVIQTLTVLPTLPEQPSYDPAFKVNQISLTQVAGLNTLNNMVNGNGNIAPSNNFVYNNDANVGFDGIAYGSQAQVEATMDAVPNTIGANKLYNGIQNTRRTASGPWTSSKVFWNVDDLGDVFSKELSRGAFTDSDYKNGTPDFNPYEFATTVSTTTAVTTVYHNLPTTPKTVQVVPSNSASAAAGVFWTWDGAKVTITANAAGTYVFNVYAKC